jgi:hypothetical protein
MKGRARRAANTNEDQSKRKHSDSNGCRASQLPALRIESKPQRGSRAGDANHDNDNRARCGH